MFNYEIENNEYDNLEECVNEVYELASKYAVPTSEAKKIELKRKIKHIIAPIIRNRGGYNIYNYGVLFIFDFE